MRNIIDQSFCEKQQECNVPAVFNKKWEALILYEDRYNSGDCNGYV